ncbi:hypothetical protein RRK80_004708, partial [Salmonella enterica]|nr:hypothetical protein [Salmonella enterica]
MENIYTAKKEKAMNSIFDVDAKIAEHTKTLPVNTYDCKLCILREARTNLVTLFSCYSEFEKEYDALIKKTDAL